MDFVLGRHRLIQVLSKGHEHGLPTAEQGQLIHGLLHEATLTPADLMIPLEQVRGVEEGSDRDTILGYARTHGLIRVPVFAKGSARNWIGYLRVLDLQMSTQPVTSLIRPLIALPDTATRLEALLALRDAGSAIAVLRNAEGDGVGMLTERSLIRHFMRPAGSTGARKTPLATGRAAAQS
jgi:CBS domain containing-hemolysin-like protein